MVPLPRQSDGGSIHTRTLIDGLRSDADRFAEALRVLCERVERDLREPDKLLCAVQSARRELL